MKRLSIFLCLLFGCPTPGVTGTTDTAPKTTLPAPPIAKKIPKTSTLHGETRTDDYFWLREKENPEVLSYIEAENRYTEEVMKPTQSLQELLYQEMLGRIQQTDLSVPYLKDGYYYYSRTEQGKQYPIYCRKKGSLEAKEEILLELNEMAKDEKFMAVGLLSVSDDGNYLAYSTDNTGFRRYVLHIKDLRTGAILKDTVSRVSDAEWASDHKTLFYTTEDDAKRSYQLYHHTLGQEKGELLYEEKDEQFNLYLSRSQSGAYLFASSESATSTEVRYLSAERPKEAFKLLEPRSAEHEYSVEHQGASFFILTNDKGRNFRLVEVPTSDPKRDKWREVIAHREEVMLEGFVPFSKYYVLREREAAVPHLRIVDVANGAWHRIELPEPVYTISLDRNEQYDTPVLRFRYQSFVTPSSVFDYDMGSKKKTLLKETSVLGGYNRSQYQSERIYAKAPDGTMIPISLVYRKGTKLDGQSPLLLRGYGAYGVSANVTFSSNVFSLLDRGVIFGLAHIRGGGDLGKKWYDQGKMLSKKNTFTDFIACAEHLIKSGYTSSQKLVINGGSAGGLLMGAVVNMRPDLFKAVVAQVPFVDVVNTMSDPSLPLTVPEYQEWGNPNIKEQYEYIRSYCPYSNLEAKAYPTMLVKTALNDSQVMYWEPVKYVAKLRTLKTDPNPLLLKVNMAAGHGGSSGRYDALRELAFDYAFILTQLGLGERS